MKRVGYDIDNVLTQTYKFALEIVNEHLGTNHSLEDCFYPTVEECFDLSKEEVNSWFRNSDKGFPLNLLPIEGAKEVINRYHGALDQYFITARSSSLIEDSLKWFEVNGFLYNRENVLFRNNTPEKKANTSKSLGLELFVDDNLHNANAIAEESGITVLLVDFDYKFNQSQSYYHGLVKTVKSWQEIDEELGKLL